jgi:Response regulator receiver domain
MARLSINLRDLVIPVADPSSYMSMLIHSMLRGFGSNKVLEARSSTNVLQILTNQKIDILICDSRLPAHGGLPLTRAIRRKQDNANRAIPILAHASGEWIASDWPRSAPSAPAVPRRGIRLPAYGRFCELASFCKLALFCNRKLASPCELALLCTLASFCMLQVCFVD